MGGEVVAGDLTQIIAMTPNPHGSGHFKPDKRVIIQVIHECRRTAVVATRGGEVIENLRRGRPRSEAVQY